MVATLLLFFFIVWFICGLFIRIKTKSIVNIAGGGFIVSCLILVVLTPFINPFINDNSVMFPGNNRTFFTWLFAVISIVILFRYFRREITTKYSQNTENTKEYAHDSNNRAKNEKWKNTDQEHNPKNDDQLNSLNHYFALLGLTPEASRNEITKAYREKIKQYHPDYVATMGPEIKQLAEEKTKEFTLAYEILLGKS